MGFILLFFIVIIVWTVVGFVKNYIKINKNYDMGKKLVQARIVSYNEERDTSGYVNPSETPLSKSDYFKGKSVSYSNTAYVQIIETGETVSCTFGKIVSPKNYPIGTIVNVYYYKEEDKIIVRSEDYPELFKNLRKYNK